MEPNVGTTDRTVRVVLGALALASAAAVAAYGGGLEGRLQVVTAGALLVFAAVMLLTAAVRRCPVNSLLGRNTRRGH
jgi:high-affinity Fe2+/Pb2+ permease